MAKEWGYFVINTVNDFFTKVEERMHELSEPLRKKVSGDDAQRKLVLIIVCIALLLDNMLYMVIVPIITMYFKVDNNTRYDTRINIPEMGNEGGNASFLEPVTFAPPPYSAGAQDTITGFLFASKAIVQLICNPFTGGFIDRVGYVKPLTIGLMVMFSSTTLFACAQTFGLLFVARGLQGLGSALADTSALGLVADRFQDQAERSKAMGIALAFISFGSLVAPPFGGVLCQFAGKEWPFLIMAFICLIDAFLLLLIEKPTKDIRKAKDGNLPVGTPIYKLFIDPYIAVIAASLMIANYPLAFLEPTIAKYMETTMNASKWQVGLVWLPAFPPHILGVFLVVWLSKKYIRYQWLYGAIGLLIIGVSTALVPLCNSYVSLILPLAFLCFGIALIDTALLPTLAHLVDVRHTSVYGSVYAIVDISYSLAYALGPILAGQAVQTMGYLKMNVSIGLANILFSPLLVLLRNVYDWQVDKTERSMLLEPSLTK